MNFYAYIVVGALLVFAVGVGLIHYNDHIRTRFVSRMRNFEEKE